MQIQTVLGAVDVSELGQTLIHEHAVTCCDWSMRRAFGARYFEPETALKIAVQKLKEAKAAGISTIVDGTPVNLGRDIPLIRRAAEASGVHVIVSTGFYHQEDPALQYFPEKELLDLLCYECEHGLEDHNVYPGFIKCAVDTRGFTPFIEKMLVISAKLSVKYQLPVFCHTIPQMKQGNQVLDIMESNGVPAHRVIVGHSGDTGDIEYLESMLERGCYLGLDRFGMAYSPETSLEGRCTTAARLCADGWSGKLFLSHDYAPILGFMQSWEDEIAPETLASRPDFTYVHKHALPLMMEYGVTQEQIEDMLAGSIQQFFKGFSY